MLTRITALAIASLIASAAVCQSTAPSQPPNAPSRGRERPRDVSRERPQQPADASRATLTIVETAAKADNLSTLTRLIELAGLAATLKGAGPFTVLAPTDDAFAALPDGTIEELSKPEGKERLVAILKHHVVKGASTKDQLARSSHATTLLGQRVDVRSAGGATTIDGATVTGADLACSNGMIQVIDKVLMPIEGDITQVGQGLGTINIFLSAMDAAGMRDMFKTPGPFTLLAPSDAAFRALPKGTLEDLLKPENRAKLGQLLGRHVIPGQAAYSDALGSMREVRTVGGSPLAVERSNGAVTIGGAAIVTADVEARNGVIQVIDKVLLVPGATSTAGADGTKRD